MSQVAVKIYKCIQDSQEYGSNDEHMVSRVFCRISVDGQPEREFYADIKQAVGSGYNVNSVEVTPPHDYQGPYNHEAFSEGVRTYFSRLVNSSGAAISLGNSTNVRMRHNTFNVPYQFAFEADNKPSGW